MKMRGLSFLFALTACSCISDVSTANVHKIAYLVFELKPEESVLFQQLACTDRYAVGLEKAEALDEAGTKMLHDSKQVSVRCHPHRRIEGQPVKYLVDCRRTDLASPWECDIGRESMMARIGGILVSITIAEGSSASLDQAFAVVKHLRSSGQLKDTQVEELKAPGEEGFVNCHTQRRHSDGVETLRCPGVDVPLTSTQDLHL
jgi:hypothetical protein